VHALRDPTRGGLATTLVEIARQSGVSILLDESEIPIDVPVRSACELLGLDPLYLANEGKVVVFVPEENAETALAAIARNKYGAQRAESGR
jgi:hydrogenase expression/formation protein HypE